MMISFTSKKLEKQLSDPKAMVQEFGELAKPLKARLAVLRNVRCLDDVPKVPPERCHQLGQNRDEQFAVDLKGQARLILDIDHDPVPRRTDGGIDLKSVTAVMVMEVSKSHYK